MNKIRHYRGLDMTDFVTCRGNLDRGFIGLEDIVDFCIDNVKPTDTVLELGTFKGASTVVFAHYARQVISVDIDNSINNNITKCNNILLIQCDSRLVYKLFPHKFYNVLYVDSVHTYKHLKEELRTLVPLAIEGARIGGHDYITDIHDPEFQRSPQIIKAVDEFCEGKPSKIYKFGSWVR